MSKNKGGAKSTLVTCISIQDKDVIFSTVKDQYDVFGGAHQSVEGLKKDLTQDRNDDIFQFTTGGA